MLRPHQAVSEAAFPGDDDPDAAHFAAVDDGEIVGTASVLRQSPPWAPADDRSWRLRGMATDEQHRGRGVGASLLAALIHYVDERGGELLWCNARTPAVTFYERAGFVTRGPAWDEPHIGPHIAMYRPAATAITG